VAVLNNLRKKINATTSPLSLRLRYTSRSFEL